MWPHYPRHLTLQCPNNKSPRGRDYAYRVRRTTPREPSARHASSPSVAVKSPRAAMWLLAPHAVVVACVALALAAGITVTLGQHRPWTTLPLAAVLGWALWRAVRPSQTHVRATGQRDMARSIKGAQIAVLGVLAWLIINGIARAEYLIVSRDPGFLTLSGLWLADHPSTDIPTLGAIEASQSQPNMLADASQAWNLRGEYIQPQGAKMLPALISVGGWLAGTNGVLVGNVVVGAAGLMALYLVARRFLDPLWALMPVALVGLSVSHIALSRAAYSEPLTLLLVFAGLAWAWQGVESQRPWSLIAAGAVTGATALVRIDGAAFAAGALLGTVVALALTARGAGEGAHSLRLRSLAGFATAQVVMLAVGYASLWRWSQAYLERLMPEARTAVGVYLAVLIASALWAATWNGALRGERLVTAPARAAATRGAVTVGGLVTVLLLALASRPLWTTVHRGTSSSVDEFTNGVVEVFQQLQGLPIEPTRTYAEHTVTWLSYYLTWPVILLAVVGFGLATASALRSRPAWALFVIGCLMPTVLYLLKPEIVPDHIWAIRRFESVAIPAFALAASLAARRLASLAKRRLPGNHGRRVGTVAVLLTVLLPVSTWISLKPHESYPVSVAMHVFTREMAGARTHSDQLCDVIDGRPVVLYGSSAFFGTLRVRCDVPVVLSLEDPTPAGLEEATQAWGQAPVVLTRAPQDLVWTQDPLPLVDGEVYQADYQLQGIPRTIRVSSYTWFAGVPNAQGELVPLTSEITTQIALD